MNTVRSHRLEKPPFAAVPQVRGADRILRELAGMLSDESRIHGSADYVFFPRNVNEIASVLAWATASRVPVTVSGARTGLSGGAVPQGGAVVSLERLKGIGAVTHAAGFTCIAVEAGVTVAELATALKGGVSGLSAGRFFYPPGPTETTAQLGGTVACNASGGRTFRHGPTRNWVQAMDVVLAGGDLLHLERGDARFDASGNIAIETSVGRADLHLPERPRLAVTKDVAGYYMQPSMELIDLFIGSEGTLGVVVGCLLRLAEAPAGRVAVIAFPREEAAVLSVVHALRAEGPAAESIEFMDRGALGLLHERRSESGAGGEVPPFPYPAGGAVFCEFPYESDAEADAILEALAGLLEATGIDEPRTWVATDDAELERMKLFRHAVPETVNSIIGRRQATHPETRKVGTDFAVPFERLDEFLALHHELVGASGIQYVIYGHVGDAHLHCNMLPEDGRQLSRALELCETLARHSVRLGGTVAAEHGLGRLKKKYLSLVLPEATLAGMRRIKDALDPVGALSPGVLF